MRLICAVDADRSFEPASEVTNHASDLETIRGSLFSRTLPWSRVVVGFDPAAPPLNARLHNELFWLWPL